MDELNKLRKKIDQIDKNLCDLINERQSLADQIIKAKGTKFPFDPLRENKLLKKILGYKIDPLMAERIWRQLISFNLSRQKKMKIGILGNEKYIIAAYEAYFGSYFENVIFSEKGKLFSSLEKNIIDIGFVEKNVPHTKTYPSFIVKVSDFPINGSFYAKKFSILINKINWVLNVYFSKKINFKVKWL